MPLLVCRELATYLGSIHESMSAIISVSVTRVVRVLQYAPLLVSFTIPSTILVILSNVVAIIKNKRRANTTIIRPNEKRARVVWPTIFNKAILFTCLNYIVDKLFKFFVRLNNRNFIHCFYEISYMTKFCIFGKEETVIRHSLICAYWLIRLTYYITWRIETCHLTFHYIRCLIRTMR